MKRIFILLLLLIIVITINKSVNLFTNFKNKSINIKIIKHFKTPKDREKGLMFVKKKLPKNSGALFDYSKNPHKLSFWMKNTFIPLDILFLDKNKKVIGLLENMIPHSLKSKSINKIASYAIETNAGTIKNNKIKIKDIIEFV